MRARLIHEIGTRAWLTLRWGEACPGPRAHHLGRRHLIDSPRLDDEAVGGMPDHHPDASWPPHCDGCQAPAPPEAAREIERRRLYDTASGDPEPGDLYWADWFGCEARGGRCVHGWTNCDGVHLLAVLPSGELFDLDGRASNCNQPHETLHRCWVRHGQPPRITVDKRGLTCGAGGGSIAAFEFHGWLRDGVFTTEST
jgi:hypothetical protein